MKRMKNYFLLAAILMLVMACLTGCGKTKLDVASGLGLEYHGCSGRATATITFAEGGDDPDFIIDLLTSRKEGSSSVSDMYRLERLVKAVTYEVSPSEGLSNGDKVTVKITVDQEALKKMGYTAKSVSKTFTVSGLTEPVVVAPL